METKHSQGPKGKEGSSAIARPLRLPNNKSWGRVHPILKSNNKKATVPSTSVTQDNAGSALSDTELKPLEKTVVSYWDMANLNLASVVGMG